MAAPISRTRKDTIHGRTRGDCLLLKLGGRWVRGATRLKYSTVYWAAARRCGDDGTATYTGWSYHARHNRQDGTASDNSTFTRIGQDHQRYEKREDLHSSK